MFLNSYRFNKKTLEFEKVDLTSKGRLFQLIGGFVLAVALVFGVSLTLLFTAFDFKTAGMYKHENELLKSQYAELQGKVEQIDNVLSELETRDDKLYRYLLNARPVPKSIREAGVGGSNRYRKFEGSEYQDMLTDISKQVDKLSRKVLIQTKSYADVVKMAQERSTMMQYIPALQPVSLNQSHITSTFGVRRHPILHRLKMHTGVDFSAPKGTPVYAPGDGKVVSTKYTAGYGREIIISHGYGYVTRYAHLSEIGVREGQRVKRGERIGAVGNSGLSTGAHLHYEVIKDGMKVNPMAYFMPDVTPEEFNSNRVIQENQVAR